MTKSKIILTRYLYIYQEVCGSLFVELLYNKTDNFKRVIFWLSELYYSGFHDEIWSLCLKIYYDYYYVKHPCMEKYILQQIEKYINLHNEFINSKNYDNQINIENKIIKLILSTYRNLFRKRTTLNYNESMGYIHTHNINSMVEKWNTKTKYIKIKKYSGRKTNFVKKFIELLNEKYVKYNTNEVQNFVVAIEKRNIKYIYYYIALYVTEKYESLNLIIMIMLDFYRYICETKNITNKKHYIKYKKMCIEFKLHNYIDNIKALLQIETIFKTIVIDCYNLLRIGGEYKNSSKIKKNVYIKTTEKENNIFKNTEIDNKNSKSGYELFKNIKTLKVCDEITLFNLNRDYYEEKEIKDIIWYNWQYYIYDCPLWNMRIQKNNGYYNEKKLKFKRETDEITFNESYGLEMDEQSKEKQQNILLLNEIDEDNELYEKILLNLNKSPLKKEISQDIELNDIIYFDCIMYNF